MSTKKLSRTIIEGGRIPGYKYERKQSLRAARRISKSILQSSDFSEMIELPERKHSSYYDAEKFDDKLSPVMRWLEMQVGRSWNKTYSKLREKFDIRTTPGRHIIEDHILAQIWISQDKTTDRAKNHEYYVDKQGILRKNKEYRNRYKSNPKFRQERDEVCAWLQGRYLGKVGEVLYWFEPNKKLPNPILFKWEYYYGIRFMYLGPDNVMSYFYASYRQGKRLEGKDVEFFSKFSSETKEWVLEQSPLNKKYSAPSYGFYG